MLVLSRKRDQQITIDEKVTITVLEVRGSQVRLGIEAPREMAVRRSGAVHSRRSKVQGSMAKSETRCPPAPTTAWTLEFEP
ncbi:MAG: carbon storage regulator [Pirellulaceae bacterium]|nr:carbon storage regulator [Pirellulaceae bacterium]